MFFRFLRRPAGLLFVFPVFIILLAGCATSSSKTIAIDLTDTSEVTGTWKGRFEPSRNPRAGSVLTLRVKPDGKYVYGIFNGKYEGTYRIEKGKLVLYPKTSGRPTIITYYDLVDAGNRKVLKWKSQRGNFTLSRVK